MKSIVLALILVLASLSSSMVLADSWRGHNYDRHRGNHYSHRYSNYHSNRYNFRSSWDTRYRYGSAYRGNYVSLSFGNYPSWSHGSRYGGYHRSRHDTETFIGGLLVGGLLGSSLQRDYSRSYSAPIVQTRVVSAPRTITTTRVASPVSRVRPALGSSGTRLLRDLQGNCFEISYAVDGTEQRTQLPDGECAF